MKSQTVDVFRDCYTALPEKVRKKAKMTYSMWQQDNSHPSLHFKRIKDNVPPIFFARVGMHYRALVIREICEGKDTITGFWMGSHSKYNKLMRVLQKSPFSACEIVHFGSTSVRLVSRSAFHSKTAQS